MARGYADPEIRQRVWDALSNDARIDPKDITVTVTDGIVSLDGSVLSYAQKAIAVENARSVPGVKDVVDELTLATTPAEAQSQSGPTRAKRAELTSFLSVLVGLWLVISPFDLGYSHLTVPTDASVITGILVVILACVRHLAPDQAEWSSWGIAVLGLLLVLTPFVLGHSTEPVPTSDNVVLGSITFVLGVAGARDARTSTQQESGNL